MGALVLILEDEEECDLLLVVVVFCTFFLCLLYSSLYHHHFPFPVCCDVWGLWPWYFDDPFCRMDGIEGEPDPLSEE